MLEKLSTQICRCSLVFLSLARSVEICRPLSAHVWDTQASLLFSTSTIEVSIMGNKCSIETFTFFTSFPEVPDMEPVLLPPPPHGNIGMFSASKEPLFMQIRTWYSPDWSFKRSPISAPRLTWFFFIRIWQSGKPGSSSTVFHSFSTTEVHLCFWQTTKVSVTTIVRVHLCNWSSDRDTMVLLRNVWVVAGWLIIGTTGQAYLNTTTAINDARKPPPTTTQSSSATIGFCKPTTVTINGGGKGGGGEYCPTVTETCTETVIQTSYVTIPWVIEMFHMYRCLPSLVLQRKRKSVLDIWHGYTTDKY